jgi:uncharacterized protein YraI
MRKIFLFATALTLIGCSIASAETCTVADPSGTPLNVRTGPSSGTAIRGALNNGILVVVRERRGKWASVVPDEGKAGWVWGEYLNCRATRNVGSARAEATILSSLPADVQEEIKSMRDACRENSSRTLDIYDDSGLMSFSLPGGAKGIMVDDGEVCGGERIKGGNCTTGGCAVNVYVKFGNVWRKAISGRNEAFLSMDESDRFKALVISLYGDDRNCPRRAANIRAHGSTAWKHGQCDVIVRWSGSGFTYRLLGD